MTEAGQGSRSDTWPYDPEKFSAMLRRRREAGEWNQIELAKKLNISNSYLSQLENGRVAEIPISLMRRIGHVFGMTLRQVMDEGGVLENGSSPTAPIRSPYVEDVQALVANTPDLTLAQIRQLNALARQMAADNAPGRAGDQVGGSAGDPPVGRD